MSADLLVSGPDREPRRLPRGEPVVALGLVAVAALVLVVLRLGTDVEVPWAVIVVGLVVGGVYGGTAGTVALVHRRTGVLALSSLGLGHLAAMVLVRIAGSVSGGYYPALALGIVVVAGLSVAVGFLAQRAPAWRASAITLALGAAANGVAFWITPTAPDALYPQPPGLPTFRVGPLLLTETYVALAMLGVVLLVVLVMLSMFPPPAWVTWLVLGAALAAADAFQTALRIDSSLNEIAGVIVIVIAGVSGLRPLVAIAIGLAYGVLEQLYLWNTLGKSHEELTLAVTAIVVAVLFSRRSPPPPTRVLPPGRWPGTLPTPLLLAVTLAITYALSNGRDAQVLGVAAAIATVAFAHVLLAKDRGLDMSPSVVAVVAAQVAGRLSAHADDVLLLLLVVAAVGAIGTWLVHTFAGRLPWTLTIAGLGLLLALDDTRRTGGWFPLRNATASLFGTDIRSDPARTAVAIGLALAAALVVGLARSRGRHLQLFAAGIASGTGGLSLALVDRQTPPGPVAVVIAVTAVLTAAIVAARNTALVLLASGWTVALVPLLTLHDHGDRWVISTLTVGTFILVLLIPPLLERRSEPSVV